MTTPTDPQVQIAAAFLAGWRACEQAMADRDDVRTTAVAEAKPDTYGEQLGNPGRRMGAHHGPWPPLPGGGGHA